MTKDHDLRADRLVFYSEDIERLHRELDAFLELSSATCALLVDRDGHMVARRGEPIETSTDSVAALVAGSFASTKELARLLGEDEFSLMCHQGQRENIQISSVGQRSLLAIVFDERTNLGLVRFYSQEACKQLKATLDAIAERPEDERETLSDEYSSQAAAALDDIL